MKSSGKTSASPAAKQRGAKRPSRIASRSNGKARDGVVAAVDIGGTNLRIALADPSGNVLASCRTSTEATSSSDMVVAQIQEGLKSLLRQCSRSYESLLSIAAGVPGITDSRKGVVFATSYLRGWSNVPFQQMLESALHVPAAIENDVRLAAIGERWKGAAEGVDNFVFLALGTGIAAGIFVNGELIRGTNCTAGEVGYMYVPGCPEEPVNAGSPGSLETSIGGDGIRQQWRKLSSPELHGLTATEIFSRSGDRLAEDVLNRSARSLAYAIYNMSLVLDTSLFVLGGGVGTSIPLRDATERILQRYAEPVHPKIVISSLGGDAQLSGAIRLAMTTATLVST